MPAIDVLDSTLHYEETGSGTPLVLLHGNPGTSRVWRNVAPGLGAGRVLVPDLIGMGASGKPDIPYSFADHARYLDAWFDALGLDRVVLVGHDWGGALAIDWAARHPGRVAGIAFFETILKPLSSEDLSPQARERTRMLRTPGGGEEMISGENRLVRTAYTGGVLTPLSEEDLAPYLAPYPTVESRRPLLAWARQIPVDGDPAELIPRIEAYGTWLGASPEVPKLLLTFTGSPTLLTGPALTDWCAGHISALTTVPCGPAGHHAAEDRPAEIAKAIAEWLDTHGLR
ncbi:haloalkane dehalogenase [Streptomyces sp. NBC_01198]|uniref:haloalkane dehalogenase n=1 Tax=Streptomyces sp. NBC_01198 TaxID=2903769 RepID=UPI002E0EFCEE|nr:haloalkane dehalogenase [Streptomyces sp. NBC_01198]